MYRLIILFSFLIFYSQLSAFSQVDTSMVDVYDDEEESGFTYWQEGYYDSIAKQSVIAYPTHQKFDELTKRYTGSEFEYVDRVSDKMNFVSRILERFGRILKEIFPQPSFGYYEGLYDLLVIVGAIFLVIGIYRYAFSKNSIFIKYPREHREEDALLFVEQNLMDVDMTAYIEEAVNSTDYSLAIRYQQLMNIQQMQRKGMIVWDRAKTNQEMIDNLDNEDLRKDFLSCTRVYEYVWFGNFDIDYQAYVQYVVGFESFRRRWI